MLISSQPYPNGSNGDRLERVTGLTIRFALANAAVCTDTTIDPNAPNNIWIWVTEHVLELQLIPRSVEFMVTGILPAVQGLGDFKTTNKLMPWHIAELLGQDYSQWAPWLTSATGKPIDRIFNTLGSTANPTALLNAETRLNSVKGRIFSGKQPIGDAPWQNMNAPDITSATAALDELRMVISVFSYLNSPDVTRHLVRTFRAANTEWQTFQATVNLVHPGTDFSAPVLWRAYMVNFMERTTQWVRPWVNGRLLELETLWQQVYNAAPNQATRIAAFSILQLIRNLREELESVVDFDTSVFVFILKS